MEQRRTHYFPAQDETVVTGLCPNGQFGAYREQDDGLVRGYGHSRLAAIADMVEAIGSIDDDTDPKADRLADARDHARDLREEA